MHNMILLKKWLIWYIYKYCYFKQVPCYWVSSAFPSEYISKPFKIEALLLMIKQVIEELRFEGNIKKLKLEETLVSFLSLWFYLVLHHTRLISILQQRSNRHWPYTTRNRCYPWTFWSYGFKGHITF